jgi:hypothetical protein
MENLKFKMTNETKVIARRGKDSFLISNSNIGNNGKYNPAALGLVYDQRQNRILGEDRLDVICGRGYWEVCDNDKQIIEKIKKML